ncbi:MAG TPA: penicillin-binding protein 2 [Actinomycetota bacterium]|nr:penicillin-binding protein 2 [Actinomycetota bacterium]
MSTATLGAGSRLIGGRVSGRRVSRLNRPSFRLMLMLILLATGLVAISARMVFIQVVSADRFTSLAAEQRERRIDLAPQRGAILDRAGNELAISLDHNTVIANPRQVPDKPAAAAALAPLLGASAAEIEQKLNTDRGFVYVARKVGTDVGAQVASLNIPGVSLVDESKRFYPSGSLAAHIVGFVGLDNEGLGGLESAHDGLLTGKPGFVFMERDPKGRAIAAGKFIERPPAPGHDIVLAIDREIQYAAEAALAKGIKDYGAKAGTVIVMNPENGDILAIANQPTFDPNSFAEFKSDQRRNRALVDVYEPGSANKVITAAAALEAGVVGPSTMMKVPDNYRIADKVFHDSHPHPVLNLSFAEVIQQSSNIGTIKVGLKLGKERLYEYMEKFGYGKPTGLDFPGESGGILPKTDKWWDTSMGTIPIGQGVAVTPMQIMGVFATVANDGLAVQPQLVKGVIDEEGKRKPAGTPASRKVIEPETARTLTEILVGVTESKNGTGKAAAVPGYKVAGKTGTAQKPNPKGGYEGYIGSFIGYAPAEDAKLVVGVMLDDPTPIWGGVSAAPVFKEVMQFSLRHLGIGPGSVLPPEGAPLPAPDRSGGAAPDPSKGAPVNPGTAD